MAERLLNLYSTFRYNERYKAAGPAERKRDRQHLIQGMADLAPANHFYTIYPTRSEADIMVWSAIEADDPQVPAKLFPAYAELIETLGFLDKDQTFWGMTRVSMYSRAPSEQDMDPMEGKRAPFLIVYPFSKTKDWYLMSMDARQGQMNEHIKLGKQYFDIKQLLLYSFGLQDQEFVVSYETEDLARFSELVNALRSTEARRYTLPDTPIITGIYRTHEEFIR